MPPATRRLLTSLIGLALLASACSRTSVDFSNVPELPAVTLADVAAELTTSERPVVLNVWASWCIPCRSEAPLLDAASNAFGAEVRFIGLNVRDSQNGARGFIAEFLADAPIEHLYDRPGTIPLSLGGTMGVPLTFFFAPGGRLLTVHNGVIDERTLALQIDELLGGG